jgi:hypothetical protein
MRLYRDAVSRLHDLHDEIVDADIPKVYPSPEGRYAIRALEALLVAAELLKKADKARNEKRK